MHVEKIDRVVFGARDVDEVAGFLSQLLGIKFDSFEVMQQGRKRRGAISPLGIEIVNIQPEDEEGLRALHFKVTDLEEAKAELERKGIRVDKTIEIGGLREVLLNKEDCKGIRVGLIAYDVPHGATIAIRQGLQPADSPGSD